MSDEEQKPRPPGVARPRLPFEQQPGAALGKGSQQAAAYFYVALAAILVGLAFYMGFVLHHGLTSAYVVAPAIGAAWFGLRAFMMLSPKD